jgi:hypothetical protein
MSEMRSWSCAVGLVSSVALPSGNGVDAIFTKMASVDADSSFPEWMLRSLTAETEFFRSMKVVPQKSELFSLRPDQTRSMKRVLAEAVPWKPKYVVDACSHVGADALHFLSIWPSIEILVLGERDPQTRAILEQNVDSYLQVHPREGPIHVEVTSDACEWNLTNQHEVDLYYIDPPWGEDCHNVPRVKLDLLGKHGNRMSLWDIVRRARKWSKCVLAKVPINIDWTDAPPAFRLFCVTDEKARVKYYLMAWSGVEEDPEFVRWKWPSVEDIRKPLVRTPNIPEPEPAAPPVARVADASYGHVGFQYTDGDHPDSSSGGDGGRRWNRDRHRDRARPDASSGARDRDRPRRDEFRERGRPDHSRSRTPRGGNRRQDRSRSPRNWRETNQGSYEVLRQISREADAKPIPEGRPSYLAVHAQVPTFPSSVAPWDRGI